MKQRGLEEHEAQNAKAEPLTLAAFDRLTGASFPVELHGVSHNLTLVQVQEIPGSPREGGGFRLEFLGPSGPVLPQGIYAFLVEGALHEIFIVPRGPGVDAAMIYEAVFF